MRRTQVRKNKRKKRFFSYIIAVLLLVGIGSLSYGGYLAYKFANATSDANQELERGEKSARRIAPVDPSKDNFSVLFVGIDSSKTRVEERNLSEDHSRTDALILATFNKDKESVKMVSIPRDSRIEIVGKGFNDRINHAHAFGGIDMTVATVEEMFDIPVDYYVTLNFNAFIDIVDTLGGIEVDVPFEITEQDSQDNQGAITLKPGIQTLNGEEALAFSRYRKDSDIYRGARQQEVIKAIVSKSISITALPKYDEIIDHFGENILTNFSLGNIVALSKHSGSLQDIESFMLEGQDLWLNGAYYYQPNEESVEEISQTFKEHLALD
ncbi:LCP family protein [Bacillus taeanensis]|uniref:LytR family transcriptional regulator n=1 Tax=Bacillus taeanensis TaxID=273032 RepID=A0A366XMK9_9BACI|nr:LCP family protein [Bacillus taeanensis]RBW67590.1 LytR family transcriptional regulator [Bacillus taeanensis]